MTASSRPSPLPPSTAKNSRSSVAKKLAPPDSSLAVTRKVAAIKSKSLPEITTLPSKETRQHVETPPVSASIAATNNATALPKVRRTRVPKDFADKYSGPQKERKIIAASVVEKKARKTPQQREQLRQLITPDDELVQRLSRVATTMNVSNSSRKPRRKAQWESRCGKCGVTTTFSTPAALCAECGAIAVRVLD